jgi:hypothetical protein
MSHQEELRQEEFRQQRSLDERTATVAEKIDGIMQARRKGEDVVLAAALTLIDGLRDELPAEAIEEWKREAIGQWNRIEPPPIQPAQPAKAKPGIGRRFVVAKPPPQAKENTETDKDPPETEAGPSVLEN